MSAIPPERPTVAMILEAEEISGAELTMVALARGLCEDHDLVAVLANRAPAETRERMLDAGARIRTVPGLRRQCTPLGFVRLVTTLRAIDPVLIHVSCSDQGGSLAPLLAAALLRKPTVATLFLVSPERRRWRELVSRFALRRPHVVIAVSESVAAYLRERGIESSVIVIGVEPPALQPDARANLGYTPSDLVVGGLGRLHRQKGWDLLCRASRLVSEGVPEAKFVIVGGGPERESLMRLADCRRVRFVGYRSDAAALLGAFDILAVPSRWEGFPRVAVEAMFAGVPVIAADIDGLPEVVADAGILVPADRAGALADAITMLARDRDLRSELAERARRRALEKLGAEQMVARTRRLYTALIDEGATAP